MPRPAHLRIAGRLSTSFLIELLVDDDSRSVDFHLAGDLLSLCNHAISDIGLLSSLCTATELFRSSDHGLGCTAAVQAI